MPKRFFKQFSPDPEQIKSNRLLSCLGSTLLIPSLWHFNRRSVSGAFGIGCFCMWIPLPTQSIIAAVCAILLRCNLPLSVALVYITNPITIPPLFYYAYRLGGWLLNEQPVEFQLSLGGLKNIMAQIWEPLLLGCSIMAVVSGLLGYYGIHLFWRLHIRRRLQERRQRQREKKRKALENTFNRKDKDKTASARREAQPADKTDSTTAPERTDTDPPDAGGIKADRTDNTPAPETSEKPSGPHQPGQDDNKP